MNASYFFNNVKTGHNAELIVLARLEDLLESDYQKLLLIFNQPGTYKLFGKGLNGLYLDMDRLRKILLWYTEQAELKKCYLYLIRDEKFEIMGGVDVQVKDENEVTLGFWADERSSGYISGALSVLIDWINEFRYKIVNAFVEPDNEKAVRTLENVGFTNRGIIIGKSGNELIKFEIQFQT